MTTYMLVNRINVYYAHCCLSDMALLQLLYSGHVKFVIRSVKRKPQFIDESMILVCSCKNDKIWHMMCHVIFMEIISPMVICPMVMIHWLRDYCITFCQKLEIRLVSEESFKVSLVSCKNVVSHFYGESDYLVLTLHSWSIDFETLAF